MAYPTRELLTHFDRKHVELTGERAVIIGGKDAKLLVGLCASHGPARVIELIDLFFASDDPWLVEAGYTVAVFVSQCGKLIARQRLAAGPSTAFTVREARAALAAMGGDDDTGTKGKADRGADAVSTRDAREIGSGGLRRVR